MENWNDNADFKSLEAQEPKDTQRKKEMIMKTAADLDNSPIEWLVPEWIPKRGVTLLCADGGIGKTFIWVSILSSLSKGESTFLKYEPGNHEPLKVMCFSGEDPENILRQRFMAAGAKLENVFVSAQDSQEQNMSFDSPDLAAYIEKYRPSIVVFDPLQAFIGASVDMSRRNQMRQALQPLGVLSSKYDLPFLIVMHTNKRSNEYGRNKMADSSDIWDISRSVLMAGFDEEKNRYISLEKSNYGNLIAVKSIIFNLDGGKVNFIAVTDRKMADFVKEERQRQIIDSGKQTKIGMCCNAILLALSDNGGSLDSKDLDDALEDQGYKGKTVRNAKEKLGDKGFITWERSGTGAVTYYRQNNAEAKTNIPE